MIGDSVDKDNSYGVSWLTFDALSTSIAKLYRWMIMSFHLFILISNPTLVFLR